MAITPTKSITDALKARLELIQWDGSDLFPEVSGERAVRAYSHPNIAAALEELLIFEDRVCLIVPGRDEYQNEENGRELVTRCARTFFILLADRDYGDRLAAHLGDSDTPGVIEMNRLVVENLLGTDLGIRGVKVMPESGEAMTVTREGTAARVSEDELAGREAWALTLRIDCGEEVTQTR